MPQGYGRTSRISTTKVKDIQATKVCRIRLQPGGEQATKSEGSAWAKPELAKRVETEWKVKRVQEVPTLMSSVMQNDREMLRDQCGRGKQRPLVPHV